MDEKYEQIFTELLDYVELKEIDAGSDFDFENETITVYCWKNKTAQYSFFKDMTDKKSTLPLCVINFQTTYEKILSDIHEYFRNLSNCTATTNLHIRQSPKTGTPVITIKQGTKVMLLETGEADEIDGSKGKWVKVKLMPESMDKDGKVVEHEITGLCFDGYLE